jgi:LPS export ABC transporter protein LptC
MTPLKNIYFLFVLMAFSCFFISCETNRDEVMAIGKKLILPSQTGKDITMLYSDSAVLKVKLQAPEMQIFEKDVKEKITILPKGFYIVFYDVLGKVSSTLKGDYGVRYETTRRMEAKYNVEVVTAKGEKLNTEHLIWDEKTKKISSDQFVKITTAKEIIMGNGLIANEDLSQYEIKEVTGTIKVDSKEL